jgi:hypothetical protein
MNSFFERHKVSIRWHCRFLAAPGNKRPSVATGFASDRVHRAGDEALDDG